MNPVAPPLPVQVPTTIVNAHKIGVEKEANLDLLEYLLYSLMLRPVIKRSAINEIEAGMRLVKEQVEPESVALELPIDRYAITKLAMAICRLEGREEIDDSAFSRSKETFFELYREFLDTRKDHFKPGRTHMGARGYIPGERPARRQRPHPSFLRTQDLPAAGQGVRDGQGPQGRVGEEAIPAV